MVSGEEKSGKTFFALAAAIVVASGYKRKPFVPTGSGRKVLILEEEGGRQGTRERILAICKGLDIPLGEAVGNIFWSHAEGVMLDNEGWQKRVKFMVERHGIELVIIDTLAQTMEGDENDKENVQRSLNFYKVLKEFCSVMYLHHCKKAVMRDVKDGDVVNIDHQYRGSSALGGAYDQHFGFRQLPGKSYQDLYVKAKDHAPKHFGVRPDFRSIPNPDPEGEPILDKWSYAMFEPIAEGETLEEELDLAVSSMIVGFDYGIKDLATLWKTSNEKVKERLASLIDEGTVVRNSKGKWELGK
jgi:hypothetical protein